MTLQRRLTLLTALVVGGVMLVAATACYAVIRAELRGWARSQKWWPTLSELRERCERAMRLRKSLRFHCERAVSAKGVA